MEREFSLQSGHHVAFTLRQLGHDVTEADVDPDLTKALEGAEVVFVALHGRDGEDGTIQRLCEALQVPYTGSPPLTCRLCFDKGLAKGTLNRAGLPTAPGFVLSRDAIQHMGASVALRRAAARLGYPLVVKPTAQGSALGLSFVDDAEALTAAALAAFDHGDRILVERFVDGPDVSVGVRGSSLEPLPIVQIRTAANLFDFETRVNPGAFDLVPATLSEAQADQVRSVAMSSARLLGLRDFGRVDMRVGEDGPMVLDVKTCPGLTETSIVPFAVSAAGLRFEDFVSSLADGAMARAPTART